MLCCLLFVFPLLASALTHYEIEGTYSKIKAESVRHTLNNRAGFLSQENEIKHRLKSIHSGLAKELFIDFFEIHGENHKSTAVFHGYLSSELSRLEIEKRLSETDDIHLYVLAKRDSIPDSSTIKSQLAAVTSCSNGGVLLPNATCACKPFYSGDACEMVQCLHEGIQIGARCSCPPGVSTVNCEPRKCLPAVAADFTRTKSSFILVINQFFNVGQTLTALAKSLENQQFIANYSTYIVVNYLDSDKGFYMQKKQFVYFTDMLNYIEALNMASGYASQPTNQAILTAQSFAASMSAFSEVIVLTQSPDSQDSGPSFIVSSTSFEDRLVLQSLAWRNRISYFIPSSERFGDPTKMKLDSYHRVAQATFGDVFYVNDSDISATPTIFDTVLPILPSSEVVALEFGTTDTKVVNITGTQYGNVTLFLSVKPGNPFPTVQSPSGATPSDTRTYMKIYTLKTDETITISNGVSWTAKALARTTTTAILGFSDQADVDVGNAYLLSGINQTISGQTVSFAPTAGALTVEILNANTKLTSSARDGDCSFSLSFGSIQSNILGRFTMKLTFMDSEGTSNTRLIPGFSGQLDFVPPKTFICLNGGTDNGDGTCQCPRNFNGTDCSIPSCGSNPVNQFPGNGQGLCNCPQGLTGDFCNQAVCYPYNFNLLKNEARTFSVVIQSSWSQAQYNDAIVAGIRALVNTSGVTYSLYQLTTFNTIRSGGSDIQKINYVFYYTADAFLAGLRNITYTATFVDKLNALGAIDYAIQQQFYDKSPIFVFVDSLPSSTTSENLILTHALGRQSQINVFVTNPFGQSSSTQAMNYYRKFTLGTGGLYQDARVASTDEENNILFNTLANYGSFYFGTETVNEAIPKACKDSISLSVKLRPTTTNYFVINSDVSNNFEVIINNVVALDVKNISGWAVYQIPGNLFGNSNNAITITGRADSSDICSGKVIVKTNEVAYSAFMPLGGVNFTNTLAEGQAYLPTVFSTTELANFPGAQNVQLTVTNTNGTTIYSTSVAVPEKCSQQAPFTIPFGCDGSNNQYIITSTSVLADYTLQRSQRAVCYLPYQGCLNGGTWNAQKCNCPGGYGGDNCEIKNCKNGGVYDSDNSANICICPLGYAGDLCQNRVCDSINFMEAADVRETDYEQLVFAVNTNVDMLLVNIYLKGLVQNLTGDTQVASNPRQYTLVTFDESNVNVVSSTWDSDRFNSDFSSAMENFSRSRMVGTRSLDSIHQSLRSVVQPSATIFVITGTNSTDPTITTNILPRQRLGSQINVVFAPQGSLVPPQPSDTRLVTAARLSGGRIMPVTQNSLSILNQIVLSSLTENALLIDEGKEDCTGGASFSFWVENSASQLILDISGDSVLNNQLAITNNMGKVAYKNQFQDVGAAVLQINISSGNQGGQWTLAMTSKTGSCFLQVRAVTPLRVIPGFISTDNDDFPKSEPYSDNQMATTVFRTSGDALTEISSMKVLLQANLYQPWSTTNSVDVAIRTRDRATCSFQFISDNYSLNNGTFVKLLVTGADSTNTQFQRTFYYQIPPADGTCNSPNGQVNTTTGSCVCSQDYFGDDCSELRCRNGGTSSFGTCACSAGYYGQFCDFYTPSNYTTVMPTTSTTIPSTSTTTLLPTTTTVSITSTSTILPSSTGNPATFLPSSTVQSTSAFTQNGPSSSRGNPTTFLPSSTVQSTSASTQNEPSSSRGNPTFLPSSTVQSTSASTQNGPSSSRGNPTTFLPSSTVQSTSAFTQNGSSSSRGNPTTFLPSSTVQSTSASTQNGPSSSRGNPTFLPSSTVQSTSAFTQNGPSSSRGNPTTFLPSSTVQSTSAFTQNGSSSSRGNPTTFLPSSTVQSTSASTQNGPSSSRGNPTFLPSSTVQSTSAFTQNGPSSSAIISTSNPTTASSISSTSNNQGSTVTRATISSQSSTVIGSTETVSTKLASMSTIANPSSTSSILTTTSNVGSSITGTTESASSTQQFSTSTIPSRSSGSTLYSTGSGVSSTQLTSTVLSSTFGSTGTTIGSNTIQSGTGSTQTAASTFSSSFGTTSSGSSTNQVTSTILSTTTMPSTTVSTTAGSTITTTMGPCSPPFTTYYFTYFIDSTSILPIPSNFYSAQRQIVDGVASNVSLGSGDSNTRFSLSGVASGFTPYGLVQNQTEINSGFANNLLGNIPDTTLDLTSAINIFVYNSTYSNVTAEEKTGFAILPAGTKEDFVVAVQKLQNANYYVLGIVNNVISDPNDYFIAALGTQNVLNFATNVGEAVAFINRKACQL